MKLSKEFSRTRLNIFSRIFTNDFQLDLFRSDTVLDGEIEFLPLYLQGISTWRVLEGIAESDGSIDCNVVEQDELVRDGNFLLLKNPLFD